VAAEHEDAGRFIVRADEKLTAFLEAESAIRGCRIVLTSRRDFFKLGGAKPILIRRRTFPPLGSLPVPDEIVREHFPVLHRQGCV
jgi:hypothetical protein